MMAQSVTCRGITLNIGDRCIITQKGRKNRCSSLRTSDVLTVKVIRSPDKKGEEGMASIGLAAQRDISSFHNMDGAVPNHRGYYFRMQDFVDGHFELLDKEMVVKGSWTFKGKNLKGKTCKFLAAVVSGFAYVEFDEYVGGGAADGLGKAGHCVVVPQAILKSADKAKSKKKG